MLFLLVACKKDEPTPAPTITLLTFQQDISTQTRGHNWIYATDKSGNLLDLKQFNSGQPVVLTSNKITASDKINVTIVKYEKTSFDEFIFQSYLGIAPNENWTYKKLPPVQLIGVTIGAYKLIFNNYPWDKANNYTYVTTNDYGGQFNYSNGYTLNASHQRLRFHHTGITFPYTPI